MIEWPVVSVIVIIVLVLGLAVGILIGRRRGRLATALNYATSKFRHVDLSYQLMTPRFICTIYVGEYPCYGKSGNAIEAIELAVQVAQQESLPERGLDQRVGDLTPQLS